MRFTMQYDKMDCGPTCLKMVAGFYGKDYPLEYLRECCYLSKQGVSLLSLNDAAEKIGFRTLMIKTTLEHLRKECPLPCILHWNQDHFLVLTKIKINHLSALFKRKKTLKFTIADPAHGILDIDSETFLEAWTSTSDCKGTVLLLEPTPEFFSKETVDKKKKGFKFLLNYLRPYRKNLLQLIFGMLAASLISLAFPILTQLLIDQGVSGKNLSIIYLVLISQLGLFIGSMVIEVVRSWLLLHMNTRISLSIISDFLAKLLRLPISFFDTKAVGDLSQRINDHHRIENFLTSEVFNTLFSLLNILVFTFVLAYYNLLIVLVFAILSLIGLLWIILFQKRRKQLDYKRFARNKENQDKMYEMITGMQEIKLYGSETSRRLEWERLQIRYFKLNIKSLALEQYQHIGFKFFSHLKNIIISFIAAKSAINSEISLGELLSISYIIGQTNGPIEQLTSFFRSAQDAQLSMDRLQEIHSKEEEEFGKNVKKHKGSHDDIHITNLSFQYEGPRSPFVLKNINLRIPRGKITAIVGSSGSGKTTLMKLIMGFYSPTHGLIKIGDADLETLSPKSWRERCGSVMQDGYIFFDTIARNIALDGVEIDDERMENAVQIANIKDFIEALPSQYVTKIGSSGMGLSGGQRQRMLIARSIYKNPDYLFFDEATSSLDANNETIIMNNLDEIFKGKTVVIIAHRLSTVKQADQIIVLDHGRITEIGTHRYLTASKGYYYNLVRNQLELGS